jgi:predicted metal-dependent hydrolase
MKLDVTYQNDKISFTHLQKKHIKNVYLSIDKQNGLVVKSSPYFHAEDAKRIVLEKAEWIRSKLTTINDIISTQLPHPKDMTSLFLNGIKVPVVFKSDPGKKSIHIIENNTEIQVHHHPDKTAHIPRHIEAFYRQKTEAAVLPIVERLSHTMHLYPESVAFKKYKRRWGCCDSYNRIIFNSLLAQFPPEIIRYIVIHELAHIREKNHSKRFWKIVETYEPDYKLIHRQIKGGY